MPWCGSGSLALDEEGSNGSASGIDDMSSLNRTLPGPLVADGPSDSWGGAIEPNVLMTTLLDYRIIGP